MAEEYAGILNLLDPTNATAAADIDNKIVVVKTALYNSFPNVTGAVTKTHTALNALPDAGDAETISGNWAFTGDPSFKSRTFKGAIGVSVSSAGTITAQTTGGGVTASRSSTGVYLITHNLGTTNYCAQSTISHTGGGGSPIATVISKAANSFEVHTRYTGPGSDVQLDYAFEVLILPY